MTARTSRLPRAAVLIASALAGMFGAHALGYLAAFRGAPQRDWILHGTGHGYLSGAATLAVATGLAAALGVAVAGFARSVSRGERRHARLAPDAIRLGAVQTVGFLAVELGERTLTGSPFAHLTPALLACGLLMQAVVATAAAALLRMLERGGERLARALTVRRRRPIAAAPVRLLRAFHGYTPRLVFASSRPLRAPPPSFG